MSIKAFIAGCAGPDLLPEEAEFFASERPWGFILFSRNVESAGQLSSLTGALRAAAGHHAPVFIDQEGGRVQRIKQPLAPNYPPARIFGELYDSDPGAGLRAASLGAQLMGHELKQFGINADCLPVLDIALPETHAVIGDRAYHAEPEKVAALGAAALEGLRHAGVIGVIKHIPGHGRARADSHLELPVVDASAEILRARDFPPFAALKAAPMAMTAHIVYPAFDPGRPATISPAIIDELIRGEMGFAGALMSDDISMQALSGSLAHRSAAAIEAGCDLVLHCNGTMREMRDVASVVPAVAGDAADRLERALAWPAAETGFDYDAGRQEFTRLIEPVFTARA